MKKAFWYLSTLILPGVILAVLLNITRSSALIPAGSNLSFIANGQPLDASKVNGELSYIEGQALNAGSTSGDTMQGPLNSAVDTGSANAYVVALSPALTSLQTYQKISFKAANSNTGASTLNVNGLGVKPIVKGGSLVALVPGDITAGQIIHVTYDGSNWQMFTVNGVPARSCPTGYTRALIEWCYRTTAASTFENISTLCLLLPIASDWGIPTTALIWQPVIYFSVSGNGTPGQATEAVQFYSDSGCTTVLGGDGITNGVFSTAYLNGSNPTAAYASYQYPKIFLNGNTFLGQAAIYAKIITQSGPSGMVWTTRVIDSPMFAD